MKKINRYLIPLLCLAFIFTLYSAPMEAQAFDRGKAKKNITVTYKKFPTGVLAVYKNKNKEAVTLSATMHFRDAAKKDLSKETQKNLSLGAKATATFFFTAPRDEYGNCINYNNYTCSYSVSKAQKKSYVKKISISSQLDVVEAKFAAVNTGTKELSSIHATFVFYSEDGMPIRCFTKTLSCFKGNSIDQFVISYPDGMQRPSKVKVYVDWAY